MTTTLNGTTISNPQYLGKVGRTTGHLPALEPDASMPPSDSPALEAIRSLYYHPGPFVSVNITVHPGDGPAANSIHRRWAAIDLELQRRQTSPLVIEEIAQRVLANPPTWAASLSVVAASDGAVVAGHGPEPFFADMVVVDTLPYVVPLLTWSQRRVPHLIMTDDLGANDQTIDLTGDIVGDKIHASHDDRFIDSLERHRMERHRQHEPTTKLVLLGQPAATRPVADMIAAGTDRRFKVVTETRLMDVDKIASSGTETDGDDQDGLAHRAVARLAGPDGDSDSVSAVLNQLRYRDVDVLVVPADDTLDQRRVWVGTLSNELSLERRRGHDHQARLVDAAIRVAMVSGVSVVIETEDNRPRFAA